MEPQTSIDIDGVTYVRSTTPQGTFAAPLRTGQQTRYQKGEVLRPGGRPMGADIVAEWDIPIKLRDGRVVYADLFRPADSREKLPVVIAWSPYGKSDGEAKLTWFKDHGGVAQSATSGLQKFEGPDPAFWCAHGFAILNPDASGVGQSDGNIFWFGFKAADDGYDVVEWAGTQEWSNGKVGLSGNSWLAVSQWFIAAARPPHLTAFAPWEGFSDMYRDGIAWGGIPDFGFINNVTAVLQGNNYTESPSRMIQSQPLYNDYWADKRAPFDRISIPAYIVASWTNGIHVNGTFRGWRQIPSSEKWLRVHDTHEWPDLYEYEDDLCRFYDYFLKGKENGWPSTPRVRYSILDPGGQNEVNRAADAFPLPDTQYRRYYLDAATASLSEKPVEKESKASYDPLKIDGEAKFTVKIERPTVLVGYMSVHLWVQAPDATDMDLYVFIQKVDASGNLVEPIVDYVTWHGQQARLRVSHRSAGMGNTDPADFELDHSKEKLLSPGEIVPIDIPVQPLGMRWREGDYLRVVIRGQKALDLSHVTSSLVKVPEPLPMARNKGQHVIHTGGRYQSYLLAPHIPA